MGEDVEITQIAIPLERYEKQITHLIDALLAIDEKMFQEESPPNAKEMGTA